jgi:hypothetical protein
MTRAVLLNQCVVILGMRKGISPVIAFVMIVLISITGAISLYYWFVEADAPILDYVSITVSAYPYNSTAIVIVNAEARNSSEYTHLNTSAGKCYFYHPPIILRPGVPTHCNLTVVTSGRVAVYAEGVNTVFVDMP